MGNDNVKDYPPYLDYPKERKPTTNYDLLIHKTPEELAEWIADIADHGGGRCAPGCYDCTKRTCEEGWLEWLNKEVDG